MELTRTLYIDKQPDEYWGKYHVLRDKDDIAELYDRYLHLKNGGDITLDCRQLKPILFHNLLKFVEEYKGRIMMVAYDPVLNTVSSRFTEIQKGFNPPEGGSLMEIKLRGRVPNSLKERVNELFGIRLKGEVGEDC